MDLLKANVKQLYFKYLLPSLGSAVAISIYSFVDSIAVGQSEGPDGAAVMAVFSPLYGATVCLGILCGMGGSVLMSKAKGEGNEEKGNAYFTSALVLLSLLTVAFWAASAFFYETIFMWFGADRDLIPLVMKYAKWILMFCPCFLFSIFLACFIRNDNAPGLALCAVVTGGVFNIFGDWFLVFPLGMGIEGAAIATVIGTGIQTLVLCSYFFSKKCGLKLVKPYRLFRAFKKIFATGFGSSLLDFANVILVCIFNNQIMHYGGRQELSIFGVVATISALFQALYSGIGQAAQPLISMNF
ncbi:MAG: polysaccharide biosynthesis C-terminal domain-containing protein, partial [Oscillospiraceae bacterium]|nr:polysaccharide biosynthesis C-terminal domain-containing protein [Oscillospiraceae bacterium]